MFKKIIFAKNSDKRIGDGGVYEWLIKCSNNFFCFSRGELELNKWYEIIYYQGKSGHFRVNAAQLVDYQPKQNIINQFNQQINININYLNQNNIFIMERQKHAGNCYGDKCYECWLVVNNDLEQYQQIIKERQKHATAREKFSQQERELTNGYLFLNGQEVKYFTDLKEAEQWKNGIKRDIQWSFINLNVLNGKNNQKT